MVEISRAYPYDWQPVAAKHIANFLRNAGPNERSLYTAPTGSGKGVVEAMVLEELPDAWLVTPKVEILFAILQKKGVVTDDPVAAGWDHRCTTPVRFRNALIAGRVPRVPYLVVDEAHHGIASTYQQANLLTGMPPMAGLTATAYRGSPRATLELIDFWGEPTPLITLRECVQRGIVAIPEWHVMPLVDDDCVALGSDGDFEVTSLESAYTDRLADLAEQSKRWVTDAVWDMPTLYCVPGTSTAKRLVGELQARGLPAVCVLGETAGRRTIFDMCEARLTAIVHVAVVGEGIDLKIRRIVDAAPCMSPTKWVQQLGRSTRPWDQRPQYVCTNRNLQRHAYLMDGFVPAAKVAEATAAFGGPGARSGVRFLGMEAIGRFRGSEIRFTDGNVAQFYALIDVANGKMRELACFAHPCCAEAVWAERVHGLNDNGTRNYGRWVRIATPREVKGFASAPAHTPTDKQAAFWTRSARGRGLEPDQPVNKRTFPVLPFMLDLGIRF